ncbi:1-deoxy-D-xylulose-5-phosphate reductoisomerase [Thalassospira sp. MBR-102]|jgi:1-deoxy-D-xylulose-5-phosphate reductoisomerase|uniref:1-deoxy-D-xylulose 5-phosphate reductoisomerase n=3 Tax=Thalassospira TaxID=168934 RepID=A0ABR5Y4R5_9PROT|nr:MULTISPECIES: 1-deoxy-D-xylulose-5-phosphate reductoisomerase [Thalassospira]MBR9780984.1 1-deoxy-D-xylulose-5-phosphate reductoisomerase [Rhodospirillales bacterium]KEO53629.1 1-deoxy-D-xylulose 5-phosphate reductoisomerase [Thalassospira permensis NBRC 106175]KZD05029.1 1-deoxy-D-xylulose 5-phosphate reductoisomerase [Thalassospira xiamenensis]KZD11722.1 1-deoxy-D-xylulose 5-phosphate reductoisomerase [Thalassospira xiamenensis]MAB32173.1 1-deoxy-D-xylulose-5-phosphate reductoisomerase [T|tara:strand:- start:19498 stop:20661 length:1164 start_codon:yes stop_codon:yes gene_type:complete
MTIKKSVCVLGVTGSVGSSTVDILKAHSDKYAVDAVTAHRNVQGLAKAAIELGAAMAVIADESLYEDLKSALSGTDILVAAGDEALVEAASRPSDIVIAAIIGAAGLKATLAAIRRGARVGLANKETLVCAGDLMMAEVAKYKATLIPVDSEHSAIFQVLEQKSVDKVDRILLTASGGPFREWSLDDMKSVSPKQALAHPNWDMGAKISIDSATMMNKGLELIEACRLFPVPEERIEVVVHPQSVVHSMVEYSDGSVLAQLGSPDMRTPIAYALSWPERIRVDVARLDFATIGQLNFTAPDMKRFPALRLAREALRAGGTVPTVLNAANEIAVGAFLGGKLTFLQIAETVERMMNRIAASPLRDLDQMFDLDDMIRRETLGLIKTGL